MDPLNHALIGAVVIRKRKFWPWFIVGTIAPDAPLFVAGAVHLLQGGKLSNAYFEIMSLMWVRQADNWTHSILITAMLVGLGYVVRSPHIKMFSWGYSLHVAIDLLTHVDDATAPLWPFSGWVFRSPVSYWQVQHFARPFTLLTSALVFALLYFWWADTKRRI